MIGHCPSIAVKQLLLIFCIITVTLILGEKQLCGKFHLENPTLKVGTYTWTINITFQYIPLNCIHIKDIIIEISSLGKDTFTYAPQCTIKHTLTECRGSKIGSTQCACLVPYTNLRYNFQSVTNTSVTRSWKLSTPFVNTKEEVINFTSVGPETKPEEIIEKSQTGVDQTSVSDVTNEKALSESGTNRDVSSSGSNATIPQSQQMQNPPKGSDSIPHKSLSEQNDVIISIVDQISDDDTRSTRKTSHTLCENELQTINETKDQKTQKSDKYNYTTDIRTEGKKAKRVRKAAEKKEKGEQEKAENDEKIAKDKAEKEIKSAREKAEKDEKLVKEKAEKEEATAKGKAEELEKIAKDKAEREERMVNEKAKEEEKIAKDKAEKEEGIAKRTSKKMANTVANLEESVKKISNEKEEQMTKITKSKEQQMEIIAKEKEEQLEKIGKEKREELEKIANAREKQLQEILKRKTEEIEKIKKSKEEEIEKIRKVKKERVQTIIKKKEEKIETIYKKKEEKRKKKGKENKQTAVIESHEVQRNDEQLKINEIEDDNYEVEHSDETEPCLDTNNSNVQVNPAIRSQSAPHTIVQMSELASHQDTSKAPTGTREQTLQAEDKVGTPIKNKTNEDKASNKNASTERNCTVS